MSAHSYRVHWKFNWTQFSFFSFFYCFVFKFASIIFPSTVRYKDFKKLLSWIYKICFQFSTFSFWNPLISNYKIYQIKARLKCFHVFNNRPRLTMSKNIHFRLTEQTDLFVKCIHCSTHYTPILYWASIIVFPFHH